MYAHNHKGVIMTIDSVKTYTCDNSAIATTVPDEDWVHISIQSRGLAGYENPVEHNFQSMADFKAFVANDLAPPP